MPTKNNQNIRLACSKGYFAHEDGRIESPYGIILKLQIVDKNGTEYYRFGIKDSDNKKRNINVHRFIAFLKFGENALKEGIQVRHLNGVSLDNSNRNIDIGTAFDNRQDIPPEERMKAAINASTKVRKFSDKIVEEIKEKNRNGASYKQLMKEYNISSKGTMSFIINNKYVTKK